MNDTAYKPHSNWWLAAILGGAALIGYCTRPAHAQTVNLRTDQAVASQCSKRELKRWKKDLAALSPGDLEWIAKSVALEVKDKDLNEDGVPDHLLFVGTQSLRTCDFLANLPYKEVVGTFTDGKIGQRRLWNWNGGLPTHMSVVPHTGSIVVESISYAGVVEERTLQYREEKYLKR